MKHNVRQITTEDAIAVRHPVLRKGRPKEDCRFEGDDLPTTTHFGIYENENLVGAVTFLENNNPNFKGNQLQLRGMAILKAYRGKGYSRVLAEKGEQLANKKNIKTVWCNARAIAKPVYEKLGYYTFSGPFEIEQIGIHYIMKKTLI